MATVASFSSPPAGALHDNLCEVLEGMGHLDSAALKAL